MIQNVTLTPVPEAYADTTRGMNQAVKVARDIANYTQTPMAVTRAVNMPDSLFITPIIPHHEDLNRQAPTVKSPDVQTLWLQHLSGENVVSDLFAAIDRDNDQVSLDCVQANRYTVEQNIRLGLWQVDCVYTPNNS